MRFLLTAVLVFFTLGGAAQAETFLGELDILLNTHPRLQASGAAIRSSESGEGIVRSGFLPVLTVTGDIGAEETDSPATRAAGGDFESDRYSSSVFLTLNVFDGFQTTSDLSAARQATGVAAQSHRGTVQTVILEAATSYLDVLRQGTLVALSRANEQTIQEQLSLEDERVRLGSGIKVDVLLAKSRLQVSKERRTAFETSRADALSRFEQVFGHPAAAGALKPPALPEAALPGSLGTALEQVTSSHPAVLTSQRQIDRANALRRSARGGFFPKLDLVAQHNVEDDVDGVVGTRRDHAVLARVTWELFSGFKTKSRVSQAAAEYSAAVENARFVDREAREEVALAWHQMGSAAARRDLLANAVTIAAEVFAARQKLLEAGQETPLNVLDAENEKLNACINLVNADFEHRVSVYRVLFTVGRLEREVVGTAGEVGPSLAESLPESAEACGFAS